MVVCDAHCPCTICIIQHREKFVNICRSFGIYRKMITADTEIYVLATEFRVHMNL